MTAQDQLPQDAREALARGDVIEAIRRVRVATGLGLKESKELLEAYARSRGTSPDRAIAATGRINPNGGELVVPQAAATALQHGNVIEAIKMIRDANRVGLKEAKDAVEAYRVAPTRRAQPRSMPTVMQGDRGFGGGLALAAVVLAAFAWWWLSR